ncbi:MAG: hypothetical protein ACR2PA_22765 [Hyphomicrobiaceae bacterium]
MLGFIGGLLRVIIGLVLASLAAGVVQVLFAITPAELIDVGWEYWTQGSVWVVESATIIGIFALPFGLLSALISEWAGIRSFAYHGFAGIAIAVAGFGLISAGEGANVPTIVNSYAMAAFLTTGLVAGFVYWLFSGRFAHRAAKAPAKTPASGQPTQPRQVPIANPTAAPKPPPQKSRPAKDDNTKTGDGKPVASPDPADKNPSDPGTITPTKPARTFDA